MVSQCYPLEATTMAIALVQTPANAQERALVMGRFVMTTWRLHSLLLERRVAVGAAVKAELGAVEAEVVRTEVRNKASPYKVMFRVCRDIVHFVSR